jgi:decaprenylphospho-beta-D-ribofuranose 2-oxidase
MPGREVSTLDLEAASRDAVLFRGLGRSYGDAAIPPPSSPVVVTTRLADRLRFFDRETGRLRAEAGLSLHTLNRLFLHDGWFVPVSPGTQFVTLGGMVASDIHGKSHHVDGCFGEHVEALLIRVADGRLIECSMDNEPELFLATIGGMGLTGHILEVEFRMRRIPTPWVWCESIRIDGIDSFIRELKAQARRWPFTVGWVDCLSRGEAMGRGLLGCGRWAEPHEAPAAPPKFRRPIPVPLTPPFNLLNPLSVRLFNEAYFRKQFQPIVRGIMHPESFWYPLDFVANWNRIYGPRGFTQYQCVLPEDSRPGCTRKFFDLLTRHGGASFLCVIKDCGPQGRGMLSFPMRGISVALDIAVRDNTRRLIDLLNEFVIAEGGRIYLTKDTFTRAEHFRAMEPRLDAWLAVRRKWDPQGRIRSAQSVRLFGDQP